MRCVAGPIYRPGDGWKEGWILHDRGLVVDAGDGAPPQRPDAEGTIIPAPVNAHTHIGDAAVRGVAMEGRSLDEIVKPPNGLKHRMLRETPRDQLLVAMRAAVREMRAAGCRAFLDFREQGVDGIAMLRDAAAGEAIRAIALGRPLAGWDDAEADEVARAADGIGLSGLGDVPSDVPERAARAARKRGKMFALHFSEAQREDVARALDLRPDLLVHACATTRDDLIAIADARVPIVLCPRSNAIFGHKPDAPTMIALGIPIALGSDNAMFHAMDVLLDARHFAAEHPEIDRAVWLDAATAGGARVLDGAAPRSWLRKGDEARFVVLDGDPFGERPPRALLVE